MAVNPATGDLYVANTDGDSVSVIDTASNAVVRAIDLRPYPSAPVGTNPDALASTPNGKTLFVANSGNNDVDVIDLAKANGLNGRDPILGSIPTGWYPTGLVVSQDSSHLFVVNGKGLGAGPNPQGRPRITGRRPTSTPAR